MSPYGYGLPFSAGLGTTGLQPKADRSAVPSWHRGRSTRLKYTMGLTAANDTCRRWAEEKLAVTAAEIWPKGRSERYCGRAEAKL
jgi:hypothetical protein